MSTLYIILMMFSGGEYTPICVMHTQEEANPVVCEKKASRYNDEAVVIPTADGRLLVMQAVCQTGV